MPRAEHLNITQVTPCQLLSCLFLLLDHLLLLLLLPYLILHLLLLPSHLHLLLQLLLLLHLSLLLLLLLLTLLFVFPTFPYYSPQSPGIEHLELFLTLQNMKILGF